MVCEMCGKRNLNYVLLPLCEECAARVCEDPKFAERVSRRLAQSTQLVMDRIRTLLPTEVRWSQNVPGNTCDVLVIDDDEAIRLSMAEVLQNEGLSVQMAVNGADGLIRARQIRPKVIVLDMMMPVMNGWEFLVELQREPGLARTPVVQTSAFLSERTPPAVARVRKPIDIDELLGILRPYVGGASA